MPIGNGDFAANVWFLEGKLYILLSKSDAWSEEGRLLKLGKVSLEFNPNFFNNDSFRQRLRVRNATVVISGSHGASIEIWIDALTNVLNVEVKSPHVVEVAASLLVWRDRVRSFKPGEETSFMGATCNRSRVFYPDIVLAADEKGNIVWYHRNENRSIFADGLLHEGLDPSWVAGLTDPLLNRTFGALLRARTFPAPAEQPVPFYSPGPRRLVSSGPAQQHLVQVVAHTDVTATEAAWRAGLAGLADEAEAVGLEAGRSAHAGWWGALWGRSYVDLAAEGDGGDAAAVSRGQCLERYLQVCAGRGAQPIKFNGNLFSVEERGFDADFRQVTTRGIRMARGPFMQWIFTRL
jgi:alpha-L-fucosidase 2